MSQVQGREAPSFDLTPEQQTILSAVCNTADNIQVQALAGTGKTSTIELCTRQMSPVATLLVAFNKRIADEAASRLPGHAIARTLNSVGHSTWGAALGKRLTIEKDKTAKILKDYISRQPRRKQEDLYDAFAEIKSVIRAGKAAGFCPGRHAAHSILSEEDFLASLEERADTLVVEAALSCLSTSIEQSYSGIIDFDDQIFMPTLFGGNFPRYPLVIIDEAQDLSPLNHEMLAKLVSQRLFAVGDPWQSIYGFRGSVASGMQAMQARYNMTVFTLSTSFRCPRAVIERARSRVPHMNWPDWAIPGTVQGHGPWTIGLLEPDSAVICRNNAPLFSLALRCIRNGRGVHLIGSDIGPSLVRALKKLGPPEMPQEALLDAIDNWEQEALRKHRSEDTAHDRADCLRVFAHEGKTLEEAILWAQTIFDAGGSIQLMSGHKAKGLEFETCYHLDPWRVPSKFAIIGTEEYEQELNVKYVIETRAKRALHLINLEELVE